MIDTRTREQRRAEMEAAVARPLLKLDTRDPSSWMHISNLAMAKIMGRIGMDLKDLADWAYKKAELYRRP